MQDLLEVANHHAAEVGMRSNALKTTVIATLISGEQSLVVQLDDEPLEGFENLKYL